MQIKDGEYVPQSEEDFFEIAALELLEQKPNASVNEDTVVNGIIEGFSRTLADTTEQNLQQVYDAGFILNASGNELTKRAEELGYFRKDPVKATGVVEFSRNQVATQDYPIDQGTVVETLAEDPIQFETTEDVTLTQGSSSVKVNVQALEGGTDGNVGANTVRAMPSPPTGVGSVTNPNPIGDPAYSDVDGNTLLVGQDREDDEELQNRVLREDGSPGSASSEDIATALSNIDSVIDATAVVNNTATDNTGSGGLPPYTTEIVVQGGPTEKIIETLFGVMTPIDFRRLYAGVNGTEVTDTVYDSFIESTVTGRISRPTTVDPTITVDVVVTEDFVGTDSVKNAIIEYTGGIDTDSNEYVGLTLGEDLYVDKIENAITSVEGVRGKQNVKIDENGDGTDDTTTDANGLSVLLIEKTEVVYLQSNDVVVNTTQA